MPASRQRSRSPVIACAVIAITGVCRRSPLSRRRSSGSPRSRPCRASGSPSGRRRSGCGERIEGLSASSATLRAKAARSSTRTATRRLTGLSSTTSTSGAARRRGGPPAAAGRRPARAGACEPRVLAGVSRRALRAGGGCCGGALGRRFDAGVLEGARVVAPCASALGHRRQRSSNQKRAARAAARSRRRSFRPSARRAPSRSRARGRFRRRGAWSRRRPG
jgi:hypothetical protein